MSDQVEAVLYIFCLVALGYFSGLTGYLKAEAGDALAEFAVAVAVPLLLFRTMQSADFHGAAPWSLWAVYFAAVAISWAAGHFVTTRFFGRDTRAGVVGGVSASFSNTVLLGIPLVLSLYGQAGFEVLALIISVHLAVMMAATIVVFAVLDHDENKPSGFGPMLFDFLGKLVRNPLIVGIVLGLVFRMTGMTLPSLGSRIVDALADIAGPLALFSMGLSLRRYGISRNVPTGIALTVLKLFLMPAVTLALSLYFGLPPLAAQVAVVTACMPTGVNAYLIAVQFGTGQAVATNTMTISVASAVVTTAFWISILHAVFG